MRFVFDLVEGSYIRNTVHGMEHGRRCRVFDLPTSATGTGYKALTAILRDPQCPMLNSVHPDATTGAFLEEHRLVSVERPKRYADLDLIYRSIPIDGNTQVQWTWEDSGISDHILTNKLAGGIGSLSVWYKTGTAPSIDVIPDDAALIGAMTHKIVVSRVIRATARLQKEKWFPMRKQLKPLAGTINRDTWGGYPRGTWFFFAPHASTIDRGNNYTVTLEFAERPLGWFGVEIYRDEQGKIPNDIAFERFMRQAGLPAEGNQARRNGITIASIYDEMPFTPNFSFTPDDPSGLDRTTS